MKHLALPLSAAAFLLLVTGCATHTYVAAPPPPPPAGYQDQGPPLVRVADRNGFSAGRDAGSRDALSGRSYHPQRDRAFRATPGYDSSLGPLPVYRSAFHDAFLRGYDQGYHTPRGPQ